ncbi:hypothetical protein PHYBOEH_000564 [Phytophthora boehmeriae]|uniref:RxLR effector protein n=1 Tax=Phytophthora boehmeriae TaxID=109152 RepID=A0A8T1VAA5_9STRA|nr:hypothetical protein PHYBOEH_000564 [Phytophthora boehmeriae]
MRLSNYLLVAAAALLVSCEAVSATKDSTQTQLSTVFSPDAVQALETARGGKRFLRSTKTQTYDEDDDPDDIDSVDGDDDQDVDDDKEERGWGFKAKADDALRKLIDDFPGTSDKISHWRYNNMSPAQVKKELRITNMKDRDDPNVKLYKLFLAADLRSNFKVN